MPKYFTPELANRTLPLVRRIVEDIVVQFSRWQARVREFELVSVSNSVGSPDPRAAELEHEVALLAAELEWNHSAAGCGAGVSLCWILTADRTARTQQHFRGTPRYQARSGNRL